MDSVGYKRCHLQSDSPIPLWQHLGWAWGWGLSLRPDFVTESVPTPKRPQEADQLVRLSGMWVPGHLPLTFPHKPMICLKSLAQYLKWITNKDPLAQGSRLNAMWQPGWEGMGVWGRMDTCICIAESFCCLPETMTTLLIVYTQIQNAKLKEKLI